MCVRVSARTCIHLFIYKMFFSKDFNSEILGNNNNIVTTNIKCWINFPTLFPYKKYICWHLKKKNTVHLSKIFINFEHFRCFNPQNKNNHFYNLICMHMEVLSLFICGFKTPKRIFFTFLYDWYLNDTIFMVFKWYFKYIIGLLY